MTTKLKSLVTRKVQSIFSRINSGNPFLKRRFSELENQIDNLDHRISFVEKLTHQIDYELLAKPYIADEQKLLVFLESNNSRIGFNKSGLADFAYADFENLYRGSEEFIYNRMKFYGKFFNPGSKVLDVGCGRGELITVLKDFGIEAFGIEPDVSMFEIAKNKQLNVENVGWQEKFSSCKSESIDAIVLIQVIEHLHPDTFKEFMDGAYRILKPAGQLVIETVNPHSPAALKTFWLDLTHTRPIFPESIIDLAIRSNFQSGYIVFPYGSGNWDEDIRHAGEYAAFIKK